MGIVIRIRDGRPWNFDLIPNRGKKVLFSEVFTPTLGPTPLLRNWKRRLFPREQSDPIVMTNNPFTGEDYKEEIKLFSPHNTHCGKTLCIQF
jgi:hypothetical protein